MIETNKFKKVIMKYLWRIQQSQMVISIIFWSLTLTGVFYPYVREKFRNFGLSQSNVFGGMAIMFFIVVFLIITAGLLFDRLRFWNEQMIISNERNPFGYGGRMNPRDIIFWRTIADPTDKNKERLGKLIQRNLDDDPFVRESLEKIESELDER